MAKKQQELEFGFQGNVYKTPIKHIPASELNFWEDNPRIYNKFEELIHQYHKQRLKISFLQKMKNGQEN